MGREIGHGYLHENPSSVLENKLGIPEVEFGPKSFYILKRSLTLFLSFSFFLGQTSHRSLPRKGIGYLRKFFSFSSFSFFFLISQKEKNVLMSNSMLCGKTCKFMFWLCNRAEELILYRVNKKK